MTSPVDVARWVVRRYRVLRDRSLHSHYRRRAAERLQGRSIREVVVICHGNICRSPYAEAILRRKLEARGMPSVKIHSAGFVGPDRSSPAEALAVASEFGIDMAAHRSKLITSHALGAADLVVVMSPEQAEEVQWRGASPASVVVLGDMDPDAIDSRTIRDPWKCSPDVFRSSYQRIDRCVDEMVKIIASNRL